MLHTCDALGNRLDSKKTHFQATFLAGNRMRMTCVIRRSPNSLPYMRDTFSRRRENWPGCAEVAEGYIVEDKMTANSSRFSFTYRYWRTIAGSAD
jgi:hypothetical protein